jgi:hypothetical protein
MTNRNLTLVRSLIVLAFIAVVLIVVVPPLLNQINPPELATVTCVIGSEKDDFLSNPAVQGILADRYGLRVSYSKMGSIEQVQMAPGSLDCLWPSNTSALEIFKVRHPEEFDQGIARSEIIFNSPIVLYSWGPVVDALLAQGRIRQTAEGVYSIDTAALSEAIITERPTWADLGIGSLYGTINVVTTDPTRSNSGNMFYALLANMLAGGDVATLADMDQVLPQLRTYYQRQGYMEESSGILFDQFVKEGMGARPIIANYESLLIEFSLANPGAIDLIRDEIRILYPEPTVWSSHPIIARSPAGNALLEALMDPDLQRIAWEQHGFRSGLAGVDNDLGVLEITGLPEDINLVMPLPNAEAMLAMLDALQG